MAVLAAVFAIMFAVFFGAGGRLATRAIGASQPEPPNDARRVGVWSWEEGYIAHLIFRDDSRLWIYLVNPEGAAVWELNLNGPSKFKIIPATFLDNFVPGPEWLANVSIAASPTRKHMLIWPNSIIRRSPPCILVRVDRDSTVRALPIDIPDEFIIGCADFSSDDRYLAVARHPVSTAGDEILLFDLQRPMELGVLKSVSFEPQGHPALIRRIKFGFATGRLWISAGIFGGEMYDPPLLVSIPVGQGDYVPLIQGTIMTDGLGADSAGISVLLDVRAAQGKTGVDPNNWWLISATGRNARRPSPMKGAFSKIWPFTDTHYAGVFHQLQPGGSYGEPRLVLVGPGGSKSVFTNPRVSACSPGGEYVAVVKEGTNRLEVFELFAKPVEGEPASSA